MDNEKQFRDTTKDIIKSALLYKYNAKNPKIQEPKKISNPIKRPRNIKLT